MFHSVTINGKNTWDDYHMVPANGIYLPPPPEQKRTTIDLKTGNGLLDVSTVLTGYPIFQNRSGELQYLILDPWDLAEQGAIGENIDIAKLEARVRKYYTGSNVDNIFTWVNNYINLYQGTKNLIIVGLGKDERDTVISCYNSMTSPSNKFYVTNQAGRIYSTTSDYMNPSVYTFCSKGGQCIYTSTSHATGEFDSQRFSFDNVNFSSPSSSVNYIGPNVANFANDGYKTYCNYPIYESSSSQNIRFSKTFYDENAPETVSPMPNAYDVYSELLNDIHGTSGNMLFEDDPGWYYQGHFTVRSMDTNTIRRSAIIGYELAPYKLKSTQVTKTVSTVDSSTWSSITINQNELLTMPVMPSVTISGTFSSETVTLRFTKQDGSYVEKNISQADTYTWPDVVLYKQVTVQFKGNSGKTATITFRPGRL